jgi:hypothetical protein
MWLAWGREYQRKMQNEIVWADQQHNALTLGASKGEPIWVDAIKDVLHVQVK